MEDVITPERLVHYRTQDGQPYGSESRKCSHCGIMVWPAVQGDATPKWTDDKEEWSKHPDSCLNRLHSV